MFGHKKSHSDPDIIRKMMEENETEDDDDGKYESESNSNQRSIIALSPSKAKIRSRKKKKAPEPPQPNTLPRMVSGRNNLKCESQELNTFGSAYDYSEAPRRPLPPIPLEEMPPPPPPPPPDYHRPTLNTEITQLPGKNFQKNRRVVDKWKLSKPNPECFVDKRQRSKSLDRIEDNKFYEREDSPNSERFDRNCSLRSATHARREEIVEQPHEDKPKILSQNKLNDAIIDAAKKRAERVARSRMNRNSSFKSSMNLSDNEEIESGHTAINKSLLHSKERGTYINSTEQHRNEFDVNSVDSENYPRENIDVFHNRISSSHQKEIRKMLENETIEAGTNIHYHNGNPEYYSRGKRIYRRNEHVTESSRDHQKSHEAMNFESHKIIHQDKCYDRGQQYDTTEYDMKTDNMSKHYLTKETRNQNADNNSFLNFTEIHNNSNNKPEIKLNGSFRKQISTQDKKDLQEYQDLHPDKSPNNLNNEISVNFTDITEKTNYSYHAPDKKSKSDTRGNCISNNFLRSDAIHKKSQDLKKNVAYESNSICEETVPKKQHKNTNGVDLGILPTLIGDDQVIAILPSSTISSSSISEDELEINLQLRPTLPRRPVDIPRFSPTDVWKSINLDFFKSHQQRSDVSSEEGDDIMEEKIHRINRAVAPRRIIPDRSGDSGISPDAGSPMLLNENFESTGIVAGEFHLIPNAISNEGHNPTWIPQHDLEESEYGSDVSSPGKKTKATGGIMQPKLAMPNFMFPSRSLPRTDHIPGSEEKCVLVKEKSKSRDRRKRNSKNSSETQHFNSLRNLKRALGIRSKTPTAEVNCLDANWSLSRSLPNFEDVNQLDNSKPEIKNSEISVLDHIRRSNSESRVIHQETENLSSLSKAQNVNYEWRKSFPGYQTDGHVVYLPEYRCQNITVPFVTNTENKTVNMKDHMDLPNNNRVVRQDSNNEQLWKRVKNKKKFSYQSTVRQQEKKKLEEKLAKEIEAKEKKRDTEIEWMNMVEDEFRKQRFKDKINIRQKLRIHNMQNLNKEDMKYNKIANMDKYCEGASVEDHEQMPNTSRENNNLNKDIAQTLISHKHSSDFADILKHVDRVYDKKTQILSHESEPMHFIERVRRAFVSDLPVNCSISQNLTQSEERSKQPLSNTASEGTSEEISKSLNLENGYYDQNRNSTEKEMLDTPENRKYKDVLCQNFNKETNSEYGNKHDIKCNDNIPNVVQVYDRRNFEVENYTLEGGSQGNLNAIENNYFPRDANKYHYSSTAAPQICSPQNTIITNKEQTPNSELNIQSVNLNDYASSFEDKEGDTAKSKSILPESQQPTGMKKWLRRQNRDHILHGNMPRPEPEGGRSSSDDCRNIDGRKDRAKGRLQSVGTNSHKSLNVKCCHGTGLVCSLCGRCENQPPPFSKNSNELYSFSKSPGRFCREKEDKNEIYCKSQVPNENNLEGNLSTGTTYPGIPIGSSFLRDSVEEYELHTRLCRTNSGRTFESHSYYALERRKDDSVETKSKSNSPENPKDSFFSSLNFEKELKENVRKKSRDFEKRARKCQNRDYDSDDSGSDQKESRYQRNHVRGPKKKEYRESSFSRNHPHRNAARLKTQPNAHTVNARAASAHKSSHTMGLQRINNSG